MELNTTREARFDAVHVLEETVNATSKKGLELLVFEGVSNALDAQAEEINIFLDGNQLIIRDNGPGIIEDNFDSALDIGVRKKGPQIGIGHLGQGIKTGLMAAKRARLSTKSDAFRASCQFYATAQGKAIEIRRDDDDSFLQQAGTGTQLTYTLSAKLRNMAKPKKIESILRKWFPTLFDNDFINFYQEYGYKNRKPLYPNGVQFYINGQSVLRRDVFEGLSTDKVRVEKITRNYGRGEIVIGLSKLAKSKKDLDHYGICRTILGVKINITPNLGRFSLRENIKRVSGYVEYMPLIKDLKSNKESFDHEGLYYQTHFPKDFTNKGYASFLRNEGLLGNSQSDEELSKTWKKFSHGLSQKLNFPVGIMAGGDKKGPKSLFSARDTARKEKESTGPRGTHSGGIHSGRRPTVQYISDPEGQPGTIEKQADGMPYLAINKAHPVRNIKNASALADLVSISYAMADYNLRDGAREHPEDILELFHEGICKYVES